MINKDDNSQLWPRESNIQHSSTASESIKKIVQLESFLNLKFIRNNRQAAARKLNLLRPLHKSLHKQWNNQSPTYYVPQLIRLVLWLPQFHTPYQLFSHNPTELHSLVHDLLMWQLSAYNILMYLLIRLTYTTHYSTYEILGGSKLYKICLQTAFGKIFFNCVTISMTIHVCLWSYELNWLDY